jgi:diketogulonate reductase-like aldo/keto reductase
MNGDDTHRPTRREFLVSTAAAGLALGLGWREEQTMTRTRSIPSSGEAIPVVGMGTWETFDVGPGDAERDPLRQVLRGFVDMGGRLIDSSPMYRRSEGVVGDLAAELGVQDDLFYATKVWTRGEEEGLEQMERSAGLMRTDVIDLMQVHNLLDWRTHLATMRRLRDEGRIRYLGITHYRTDAYDDLERVMRAEDLDFIQLNMNIAVDEAEERLLPLAADRGMAVLVNRPYRGGDLFRRVSGQDLPEWAAEFDCASWGQYFLKYVLGAPQVTCVIPATSDPDHLRDNMGAGLGRLPDRQTRTRMKAHFEALGG